MCTITALIYIKGLPASVTPVMGRVAGGEQMAVCRCKIFTALSPSEGRVRRYFQSRHVKLKRKQSDKCKNNRACGLWKYISKHARPERSSEATHFTPPHKMAIKKKKERSSSERDEVDVCIRRSHCGLSDSGSALPTQDTSRFYSPRPATDRS